MFQFVCEYKYHKNGNGGVNQISRMCKNAGACKITKENHQAGCIEERDNHHCHECGYGGGFQDGSPPENAIVR